jgi:hypothetical protein
VVEVKKQGEDLDSAVSQGLSYVEWLFKYREQLKPGIAQLGWDVDIDKLKLIVAAYIDPGWIKDENMSIKGINPPLKLY